MIKRMLKYQTPVTYPKPILVTKWHYATVHTITANTR